MKREYSLLFRIVHWSIAITMLFLGLVIVFGPKEYKHTMETIHKLSIDYLLGFIVIHFSGVLIAEFINDNGILSYVIRGNKMS